MTLNAPECKVLTVTRKKSPVTHQYRYWQYLYRTCFGRRGPRLFIISNNLSWDSHVMHIVLKTNRMLGLLKRTCLLITDVKVRRTLYLSLAKSQLSYATDVWSPGSFKLRMILERVQRRASRSILRTKIGEVSDKQ